MKKKISFSMEPKKITSKESGADMKENLLSINPLSSSVKDDEEDEESHLLSMNPFMNDQPEKSTGLAITSPVSSGSEAENGGKVKSRPGILKRSDESGGSQLSLGQS